MTTFEPPENTDDVESTYETQERSVTSRETQQGNESEVDEERRVHRERREGTLEGASEEARQKAEDHRKAANPEKPEGDKESSPEQPT